MVGGINMEPSLRSVLTAKRKALDVLVKAINSKIKPRGSTERVVHTTDESAREAYHEEHVLTYASHYFNLASRLKFEINAKSEYINVHWNRIFDFDKTPKNKPVDIVDIDAREELHEELTEMSKSAEDLHEFLYGLSKKVSNVFRWQYEIGFYKLVELVELDKKAS